MILSRISLLLVLALASSFILIYIVISSGNSSSHSSRSSSYHNTQEFRYGDDDEDDNSGANDHSYSNHIMTPKKQHVITHQQQPQPPLSCPVPPPPCPSPPPPPPPCPALPVLPPPASQVLDPIVFTYRINDCDQYRHLDRKVYTYYEKLPYMDEGLGLLAEWERSWRVNCWEPIILNHTHAMQHEKSATWYEKLSKLPSVNGELYELSCYLRHAAMASVGGGIMVDNDVINMNFRPDDMMDPLPKTYTTFEGSVPSMVYASSSEYERIVDYMANYEIKDTDVARGKPHTSDMHILYDMVMKKLVKVDYKHSPINNRKVFHISTARVNYHKGNTGLSMLTKRDLARLILGFVQTQLS